MKKLIALAVAAASMPAMAAVSFSGSYNVEYVDADDSTTIQSYDVDLVASASTEMDNGMTVSASLEADDSDNDGSITIVGAFGTLALGDVAGALDAVDGVAIATARDDLAAAATAAGDAGVSYKLPTLVDGLALRASYSTEQGGNGATADATSFSADYTVGGLNVFYGVQSSTSAAVEGVNAVYFDESADDILQDGNEQAGDYIIEAAVAAADAQDTDVVGYGVSYSMNGFTVGYNASETEVEGDTTEETSGISAGYVMGNLTLAINTAETEDGNGNTTADAQTMSAAYVMGGGVTAYVSQTEDDEADNSEVTRVGIKFAF